MFHVKQGFVCDRFDLRIANVRALLELGASPFVRNCRGDMPVQLIIRVIRVRYDFLSTFGHVSADDQSENEEEIAIRQLLLSAQ